MMDTTTVSRKLQCAQCGTFFIGHGCVITWTDVNGLGPYCERCLKEGVSIIVLVDTDAVTRNTRSE